MGSGNQHSSRPDPPAARLQPPSRQSTAPRAERPGGAGGRRRARRCPTWPRGSRRPRRSGWRRGAASTQVRPGAKPAPTTRAHPARGPRGRVSSRARTSSTSSRRRHHGMRRPDERRGLAGVRPAGAGEHAPTSTSSGSVVAPRVDGRGLHRGWWPPALGPGDAVVADHDRRRHRCDTSWPGEPRPDRADAEDRRHGSDDAVSPARGRRARAILRTGAAIACRRHRRRSAAATRLAKPDGHARHRRIIVDRGASWNRTSDLTLIRGAL